MPGLEGKPPSADELRDVREKALAKLEEKGLDNFYPTDVERIRRDDHYVTRFWKHVFDQPGDQGDEAVNTVIRALTWRKKFGVEEILESTVNRTILEKGSLFTRNRDKDGKKVVVLWLKNHVKGEFPLEDLKRMLVYYMERLEREENGELISWVFDCKGAGLKNMDLDFVTFIIEIMEKYYPWILHYIYIFEMPFVLNMGFKVVKGMLPAAGVAKLKDVTKKDFNKYIDEENRLEQWGGSDDWEFQFEPEVRQNNPPKSVDLASNGHDVSSSSEDQIDNQGRMLPPTPRDSDAEYSYMSMSRAESTRSSLGADLLRLTPQHMVIFDSSGRASLRLENVTDKVVGFKLKTTSPDKFRVKPSTAAVRPRETMIIDMGLQCSLQQSLQAEKFLVSALSLEPGQDTGHREIHAAMKRRPPEAQYRLLCGTSVTSSQPSPAPPPPSSSTPPAGSPDMKAEATKMTKKLNKILENQEELEGQVKMLTYISYGLGGVCLLLLLLVFLVWLRSPVSCPLMEHHQDHCSSFKVLEEPVTSSAICLKITPYCLLVLLTHLIFMLED